MKTNRTQGRVLQAIALLDEHARSEYANHPDESIRTTRHFLHSFKTIERAVAIVSYGRKSSQLNVSRALEALVENETLTKSGGGLALTLYILNERG